MNSYLLLLFIPAVIIMLGFKLYFRDTISWKEMIVQLIVPIVVVALVWNTSRYSTMADTEVLNGKVTGKEQKWVSCSHSYSCNCRTVTSGSGNNQTTSTVCDTCYEHFNDWNWDVHSTVGDFTIDRVDRRGSEEPSRWSIVAKDQPVALDHDYVNYIRAAPDSLLRYTRAKFYKGPIPAYPSIYDYHRIDRVQSVGQPIPNLGVWNEILSRSLNDLGGAKQVNINLILTSKKPIFADALRASWLGGKKNDVTVIIGTTYPTIRWVRVFSWAKQDIINIALRNELMESKQLDPQATVEIITKNITEYYQRRPMADFEYLADEAVPATWVLILALLLSVGASVGLGIFFHRNECFEFSSKPRRYPRRY